MKLKLDENLGTACAEPLRAAGHDVATVPEQSLSGAPDEQIIRMCTSEHRALVTLDLDFGNPLRFRPRDYPGIAVLRLPRKPTLAHLKRAVATLISGLGVERTLAWLCGLKHIRETIPFLRVMGRFYP